MDTERFTVTFTTPELLCAATALGIAVFPLPLQKHAAISTPGRRHDLAAQGQASLQRRGLIQAISPMRQQVDNLLAILVHWFTSPDFTLQLKSWGRSDRSDQASLYFWQRQALWLDTFDDTFQFTFFDSEKVWLNDCLDWIGHLNEAANPATLQLPRLNLAYFLPKVWEESADASRIMERAGLSPAGAQQTLEALFGVEKVVTLNWLEYPQDSMKVIRQILLLWSPTATWGGDSLPGGGLVTLRPFAPSDLIRLLTLQPVH